MRSLGIYTIPEAAQYTSLHPARIRSWFTSTSAGRHVFRADYARSSEGQFLSFHDLIDALVAGQFRNEGLSMHKLRKAYEQLQETLNTAHPFCHEYLYTDGKAVFFGLKDQDKSLTDALSKEGFFSHVIKPYLRQVNYEKHLAVAWRIQKGVVLNPAWNYGHPTIAGGGPTTYTLACQWEANKEDTALVADLYGVTKRAVMDAVAFERKYTCKKAA